MLELPQQGLRVRAGERVAILGPSGAGKSTLLKRMAGGDALMDGRPLRSFDLPALARRRAVLPQSHAVAFGLPVSLVVSLGRVSREPDPHGDEIARQALRLACADGLWHRRFDTLSGGEQARVQLARVFAQLWDLRDALLLVDEPLAALDPGLQFELLDAMEGFAAARNHALVAVLHDVNHALAHFDRLWLLRAGALVADLPADEAALGPLQHLYGVRLRRVDRGHGPIAVLVERGRKGSGLKPCGRKI